MAKLSWFLIPLTLTSWYMGRNLYLDSLKEFTSRMEVEQSSLPKPHHVGIDGPVPADTANNIFYFIQISDLHISAHKSKYLHHLRLFLNTTLKFVHPRVVLVTGDLTDAKDSHKITSAQIREEWVDYHTALVESGVIKRKNFWFDQRGNHDCFNVPSWQSHHNYFKELSSVKDEHYSFQIEEDYGKYSFIALDACPIYGPSRPFNFFGYFDRTDMEFLKVRLLNHHDSNHTFILSHYPFSMTLTATTLDGISFDALSQYISLFLSGHLHKLAGGLGEMMHIHHPQKFLELELADMKSHGSYRIIAVDHDLISFVDSSIIQNTIDHHYVYDHPKPVVLITNPKDSRYIISGKEPVHRIKQSSFIRFLIFSSESINEIHISIDGVEHRETVQQAVGYSSEMPLWVSTWDPYKYDDGSKHTINITALDTRGQIGFQTILFRLDGIQEPIESGFGGYIISPRYEILFRNLFIFGYMFLSVGLLLFPKLMSVYLHRTRRYHRWRIYFSAYLVSLDQATPVNLTPMTSIENIMNRLWQIIILRLRGVYRDFQFFVAATLFRLVTLASLPSTFYPLYFYFIYILIGPYFVGELIPSSRTADTSFTAGFGWFYMYGVYIEGRWVPITDTWLYALFELAYLMGPLIVYLSFCITPPEQLYAPKIKIMGPVQDIYFFPHRHNRRKYPLHRRIYVRISVMVAVMYQLSNVFFIGIYYGKWAVILSPGKTWFVLWSCYALWVHRWSSKGREIDLLEDDEDKKGPRPFFSFLKRLRSRPFKKE